jgi:hypothetical protein
MSKQFSLEQLTEGIRQRHLGTQNRQLVEKWSRTGLLRGLDGVHRENMSRMLENQASQVLKESSALSAGSGVALTDSGAMRGFTNIAFPIVRRVFGGLIANDLVSIQPMSLPSGLLFYLDYTRGDDLAGEGYEAYGSGSSLYNNPAGSGVRSGSQAVGGMYDLGGTGYSRVHHVSDAVSVSNSGSYGGTNSLGNTLRTLHTTGTDGKLLMFDPQLTTKIENSSPTPGGVSGDNVYTAVFISLDSDDFANIDKTLIKDIAVPVGGHAKAVSADIQGGNTANVRRLNELGTLAGNVWTPNPMIALGASNAVLKVIVSGSSGDEGSAQGGGATADIANVSFAVESLLSSGNGSSSVIPAFESDFAADPQVKIPEIDIKVESIPVVANTRKLRARWSPELAQDLNAYHSLDAEVELTQILSEQIALEIDREILNDLLTQAGAANYYWSRAPGKFVNKESGAEVSQSTSLTPGPAFRGTVREWYETLVETIIDVANQIHRKTLRGSANFIVVGPDVATIFESSVMYKPSYSLDGDGQVSGMVLGADKVGTLSNRFTVYKDPYFPRNKVLVGYKGGSYLETGYVYAPYVPLIVTPTIFAPEDFTPRKGVMTRYGKKMVRNDFYGTVTCMDMNVI